MKLKLKVSSEAQRADLWRGSELVKSYVISTAGNGLGCEPGSYCTPTGRLRVAQKIGDGAPLGAVFKARVQTGQIWSGEPLSDDLVLTRILWLEGLEDHNANTMSRYVYLHGTNQEARLGTPCSHGCIRFSNIDIAEVFELLDEGSEIEVL